MANQQQIYHEIERSAARAHPDLSAEQAVSRYLSDHPAEYDRYLTADAPEHSTSFDQMLQRLAQRKYPDEEPAQALTRYVESHPELYDAYVGIAPSEQPPTPQADEQAFVAQARAAFPDLSEPEAVSRYLETPAGSTAYRALT